MKNITSVVATFGSLFLVVGYFHTASGEATFCGSKTAEPGKTCVSMRLPWQDDPIFFCTEKSNIRYRNQCSDHSVHCAEQWRPGSLLIATPWDCCPISSVPDPCSQTVCPPPPFNRTCTAMPVPEEHNPWECCPKYFCDAGSRKECSTKQLMPGCTMPPKDKINCIGFRDENSCCNQYQCDGDGKPGMCPMQLQAMKYSASAVKNPQQSVPNSAMLSAHHNISMGVAQPATSFGVQDHKVMDPTMGMAPPHKMAGVGYGMPPHMVHSPGYQSLQCVGDYNCPGVMKCCSNDINVYSDGTTITRNYHSTYGFCVEPMQ